MDFERIASDWLRVLRGRRSQRGFSKRLGYRSNIAYRWEAGACFPSARELFAIAARFGLDVEPRARGFLGASRKEPGSTELTRVEGIAAFLRDLRQDTPIVELARRSGFSRFSIGRWLKGEAEPRVPELLALVQAATFRAVDFVACFVDPRELPSAAEEWRALEAARTVAYDEPWSSAVLHALELRKYRALRRHRTELIAEHIGITKSEVERCLAALSSAKLVRLDRGRYVVDETRTVDTRADRKKSRALRAHWVEVALERLKADAAGTFGFNVMAISARDFGKLRELHRAYFRDMQALVAESEGSDHVVLFNTQLLSLDGESPPEGASSTARNRSAS